ncbi:DUF4249 domain-containing protein [Salinimicrobium soli]|uniref:DUF4249 domain-containing protein n=1 Tax=Salinimicrobium soli TaxID=1254399 RepID=UPI003AAA4663
MKKLFLLILLGIVTSCEEVVEVDLETSAPRLVVEASLVWNPALEENVQYILLTTTAPFFDDEVPPALDANVSVFDQNGEEYVFTEIEDGIFQNSEIEPVPGMTYELVLSYEGEVYTASEKYVTAPQLEFVEQKNDGGFDGEEIELKAYYTDPAETEDYYLFKFYHDQLALQIYDDEFTNGNRTFAFYSDEDLESGDSVGFEIQGISEDFYEYMFILRSQAGTSNGGPFQTQPTIVRGNIVNTTNPDNFAFGYFRLSQADFFGYELE